jgi:hypothetical protein
VIEHRWQISRVISLLAVAAPLLVGCQSVGTRESMAQVLFDDFSYTSLESFTSNGWVVRSKQGWPGVEGASWEGALSFVDDETTAGNRLIRLTAQTDGSTTRQAQFCHERKYLEGTYAARVRFSNGPIEGPDGDQVVETFYTITPLKAALDPDYSEQDFEYLPNGGWGGSDLTLHNTTWETFRPPPEWLPVNATNSRRGDLEGWHTLVLQVADQQVHYYLDGQLLATHGEPYYPESPMSINFNLWFIAEGLIASKERRVYTQDVDWVFHEAGRVLAPADVDAAVSKLRATGIASRNNVLERNPALASTCDL